MKTVYSALHEGHANQLELNSGALVPGFEEPARARMVLARVEAVGLGPVVAPQPHGLEVAARVHTGDYVAFLEEAWGLWAAQGRGGSALPFAFPARGLRRDKRPADIDALLGFYSFDAGAAIVGGTWDAARASMEVALTGADLVAGGERTAFSLCRPPGHHASKSAMGGYCYLNNAAIAAQRLRDRGAARVAVLDVDYHHGNGTQDIFYERGDVGVWSIHADPAVEYPFYLGYADERGTGAGEGFNRNLPLPWGTEWAVWAQALDAACGEIEAFAPDALVVSLGVDTFERDPISRFRLRTEHYPLIGARIAGLTRPTLFVMEGGYAVEAIGENAVGVLAGFEGA